MPTPAERVTLPMPTAAIYTRVSTGNQEIEGTSLGSQEDRCREYAASQGYTVDEAHLYVEVHTGIELWERPQLTAVREAFKHRAFDVLVVYAIDRLARDPVHLGVILTEAQHHDVRVEFVSEVIDDSIDGQMIRFLRGIAAKIEHEKIRERAVRSHHARAKAGKMWTTSPAYGYIADHVLGKRTINDAEADVIREIFTLYVDEGYSMGGIAALLNERGVPSPTVGKKVWKDGRAAPLWAGITVRYVLKNETYGGTTYALRWKGGDRARTKRPREEWILLPPDTSPAIVDQRYITAAQDRMATNRGDWGRNNRHPMLLRGFVYCHVCDTRMWLAKHHSGYVYRCSTRYRDPAACSGSQMRASRIEPWAWDQVRTLLMNPDMIDQEVARQREAHQAPQDIRSARRLHAELQRLTRAQDRIMARFTASDAFPWDVVEREIQRLETEKADIRAALAKAQVVERAQQDMQQQLATFHNWRSHIAANLDTMSVEEQRRVLEVLGVKVRLSGETWDLTIRPVQL